MVTNECNLSDALTQWFVRLMWGAKLSWLFTKKLFWAIQDLKLHKRQLHIELQWLFPRQGSSYFMSCSCNGSLSSFFSPSFGVQCYQITAGRQWVRLQRIPLISLSHAVIAVRDVCWLNIHTAHPHTKRIPRPPPATCKKNNTHCCTICHLLQ